MDEIMTTQEAAKLLGIAQGSVSRLIRNGTLKGEWFGSVWMVHRDSVEEYKRHTEGKSKFDRTRGKQ